VHASVLRLPMVYGLEGQGNLALMIAAIARHRFPPWPRHDQRRSAIHVADAVRAALLCAGQPRAAGQVFLVTDGGLHHHLAASGNFGQVIRKNYPVAIGNRMTPGKYETVSVVGPLCTPLDLLADHMELAEAQPGDLVVIFQSGAYGFTASPQAFLGHPRCVEVLV